MYQQVHSEPQSKVRDIVLVDPPHEITNVSVSIMSSRGTLLNSKLCLIPEITRSSNRGRKEEVKPQRQKKNMPKRQGERDRIWETDQRRTKR